MNIESVVCPCCNHEFRVNVPWGKEIAAVYIASTVFTGFIKGSDVHVLCPRCFITVYVKFV